MKTAISLFWWCAVYSMLLLMLTLSFSTFDSPQNDVLTATTYSSKKTDVPDLISSESTWNDSYRKLSPTFAVVSVIRGIESSVSVVVLQLAIPNRTKRTAAINGFFIVW